MGPPAEGTILPAPVSPAACYDACLVTSTGDTFGAIDTFPRRRGGALRRLLFAFLLTVLAGIAFSAAFVLGYGRLHDGKVIPGITVGGVAVGGLDRAAAEARVREALPALGSGTLTMTIGDSVQRIPYAELAGEYDVAPALDRAFAIGRSGTFPDQVRDQLASLTRGRSFALGTRYDESALHRAVQAAARAVATPAVDASIVKGPSGFSVTPARDGFSVDEAAAVRAATEAITATAGAATDSAITLQPTALRPTITTEQARAAVERASRTAIGSTDVTVRAGGKALTIPSAAIRSWVDFTVSGAGQVEVTFDPSGLRDVIEPWAKELDSPATSATFAFAGGKVVPVPGSDGSALDVDAAVTAVERAIRTMQPGASPPTLELPLAAKTPPYTTAQALADAAKMRLVSAWDTLFVPSDHNFFGKNISLPTSAIDGYLLPAGGTFDFWKVVGEVSRRTGYGPGGAIVNGRTQPTGALAGGICSCSTTLFNAALRLGLDMGARRNHYRYIERYPLGLDATVFKSNGGTVQTMSFTNDTPYPILIRGINSRGRVRFELWSQPTGRVVRFTKPLVRSVRRATDETACTADLRPGQKRRVEGPANGMQVSVTRTVTDASGAVLHQETFRSNYGRVNGLVLFGKPAGYTGACTERLPA